MRYGILSGLFQATVVIAAEIPMVLSAEQVGLGGTPPDPAKERARAVERAKTALSRKLDVPISGISLDSATEKTWPNTSLGCPEKDRMYAQVVTSGFAVVLGAKGTTHEVHVSARRVVFCPAPPPPTGRQLSEPRR